MEIKPQIPSGRLEIDFYLFIYFFLAQKYLQMQHSTKLWQNVSGLTLAVVQCLFHGLLHSATWVFVFLSLHCHNAAHFLILACLSSPFLFCHTRLDTYPLLTLYSGHINVQSKCWSLAL